MQAMKNSSVAQCLSSRITLLIKKSLVEAGKNIVSELDQCDLEAVREVLGRFGWSSSSEEFCSPLDENGVVALQKELHDTLNDATLSSSFDLGTDSEDTWRLSSRPSVLMHLKDERLCTDIVTGLLIDRLRPRINP